MTAVLRPCGTHAAYNRHLAHGEEPCGACRAAHAAYVNSRRPRSHRKLQPCGTAAAYRRHVRRGETPCVRCVRAQRLYERLRHARARAQDPMGTCAACVRWRPIRGRGWCASCVTRWYAAGRPESGPPALLSAEELRAIRARCALEGYLSQVLARAIRRGGWEWAA